MLLLCFGICLWFACGCIYLVLFDSLFCASAVLGLGVLVADCSVGFGVCCLYYCFFIGCFVFCFVLVASLVVVYLFVVC